MRHLFGVILGIVVTAALFVGGGWGYHRLATLVNATSPHLTDTRGLTSLGAGYRRSRRPCLARQRSPPPLFTWRVRTVRCT